MFCRSYDFLRWGSSGGEVGYYNPALLSLVRYPGKKIQMKKCVGRASMEPKLYWIYPHVVSFPLGRWKPYFRGEAPSLFRGTHYGAMESGFKSGSADSKSPP